MTIRTKQLESIVNKLNYGMPYTILGGEKSKWRVEEKMRYSVMVFELMANTYRQALMEVIRMAFKDGRFTKREIEIIVETLK